MKRHEKATAGCIKLCMISVVVIFVVAIPVEKAAAVSVTDTILHSGDGGFLSDHYYHWTVCDNGIQYDGEYDAFHRRQSDTSVFSNHSIHSQRGS